MKSLLKEFSNVQTSMKNSDGSDAGKNDIANKVNSNDIGFVSMRNTINSDGEVTGSDVANYLERAAELNDEVDTVPFGLETDDGQLVKVYVNAKDADKFEEKMKKILGIEDDIEDAINKLAQEFDIVDVVWPKDDTEGAADETEGSMSDDGDYDALDDGDDMVEVARYDDLTESVIESPKAPASEEAAAAVVKLNRIVGNLTAMGPSGVAAATGYDRKNMTKFEMISKYVQEKYTDLADKARSHIKQSSGSEAMPYWLRSIAKTK